MARSLTEISASIKELQEQLLAIQAASDKEGRDFTPEELDTIDSLNNKIQGEQAQFDAKHTVLANFQAEINKEQQASQKPQAARQTRISYVPNEQRERTWGFKDWGDYLNAVVKAGMPNGRMDERFRNAPTTAGVESVGPDGGFAVPPDFRATIEQLIMGEDSLVSRCTQVMTSSNSLSFPLDDTTPWQTSGGFLAYWEGELDQLTQSKPSLKRVEIKTNKVACLVPLSDELVEDAAAMASYVPRKLGEKITFAVNLAIVQGNGVGQPLGILAAPSLISVAAEGSQTADTVIAANVRKMWARCYEPCRRRAVWLINQDVEPQLQILSQPGVDGVGNAATGWGIAVYVPSGGYSGAPYSTLFGRPIVPTQACETLGDVGDIILADLTQYFCVMKSAGPQIASSIHLYFDYMATAIRASWRIGGQPLWPATIAARDGSATYGPFVALAAR